MTGAGDGRDLPEQVFGELARPIRASDLTGRVMRRLGHRGGAGAAWRRRALMAVITVTVIGAGVWLQRALAPPRLPSGPTIPSAIRHDFDRHEQTLNRAARTIRQLSPALPPLAPPSPPEPAEPDETGSVPPAAGQA